jgi:hypothetical protein
MVKARICRPVGGCVNADVDSGNLYEKLFVTTAPFPRHSTKDSVDRDGWRVWDASWEQIDAPLVSPIATLLMFRGCEEETFPLVYVAERFLGVKSYRRPLFVL